MANVLMTLPREVFILIIEKLTKGDLKRLSQASRWLRESIAHSLWKSITIKARNESRLDRIRVTGLPQSCLQHATQLHFRSDFESSTTRRCPHAEVFLYPFEYSQDFGDEHDEDDEDDQPRFDQLTQKAESLIRRFEPNQLQSFSWDLGTCVPPEILGVNGVVPLQQPSLQSLSLITDPTCSGYHNAECEIDLSSFCNLVSLSWRGPNSDNLDALSVALRRNSTHLRKLELDFVNWHELRDYLGYFSDDEDDMDDTNETDYFADVVLGLNRRSARPLFPSIRELSLSQVPLSTTMARAFNFETLSSLTLRMCPNSEQFVKSVMQLNHPIKLKKLEIQESVASWEWIDPSILDFLNAFEGLEELFVSQPGPVPSLELWGHVAHRHPTLKRFIDHQRIVNIDEDSPHFEKPCDLPDLGIVGRSMRRIKEDPSQNPLTKLDLEFIGLACIPKRLKYILLPFTSKTSLKVLHIRQSALDLEQLASWAIIKDPVLATSSTRSDTSSENGESLPWTDSGPTSPIGATLDVTFGPNAVEASSDNNGGCHETRLQPEFRQFLDWVFGPQGIASLDIVAFGDFAHGGRETRYNLLLCRSTNAMGNFRFLDRYEQDWAEVRYKYRDAMEACPVEPLFRF